MQDQPIVPNNGTEQYHLFILRVWQDSPGGPKRFMLKAADNDHRHIFASAQSMADFLEKTTLTIAGEI